jgi:hypothetical protein
MALRIRRGTDAERQSITPLEGELIYATDTKELYVGDGSTIGGVLVSAALSDDTSPTLSGDLSLNGHDIVGTGNINISGTITATGTVNLGDGVEDNVIVGGQIGSSLIPGTTDAYNLGDNLARWNEVHAVSVSAESVTVNGEIAVGSIVTDGSIIRSDSTVVYNAETGALAVGAITANGTVEADAFIGSVFGDDSTPMVDAVGLTLSNGSLKFEGVRLIPLTYETIDPSISSAPPISLGDLTHPSTLYTFTDNRFAVLTGTTNGSSVELRNSRGSLTNPTASNPGDVIAPFKGSAYDGSDWVNIGQFGLAVDPATTVATGQAAGSFFVGTISEAGATSLLVFTSLGVLNAPVFKATGYATGSLPTATGANEEGYIVFDTTTKEFKGWNGSAWVVLG